MGARAGSGRAVPGNPARPSDGGSSPVRSSARVRDDAVRAVCRSPLYSSRRIVSTANEFTGSQVGSQCRQEPGDVGPHRARVYAAKRHAGRLLGLSGDGLGLYGMQEVMGSNPLSSTAQDNISNSCTLTILVLGSKPGWKASPESGLAIVLHRAPPCRPYPATDTAPAADTRARGFSFHFT